MSGKYRTLKAVFPHTIPVLTGYLFLGIAFGILMSSKGLPIGWTLLLSSLTFAGSMQFLTIILLTSAYNPIYALALSLMVNARHIFYGISMLDKYRNTGKFKSYLIFGLTDETFSITCTLEPPAGIDRNRFLFLITLLDHGYWVIGSALGGLFGNLVPFNTKGLDFVLTALFVVILIGQWKRQRDRRPAAIGIACSVLSLLIFGPSGFIIPAMLAILATLTLFRNRFAEESE